MVLPYELHSGYAMNGHIKFFAQMLVSLCCNPSISNCGRRSPPSRRLASPTLPMTVLPGNGIPPRRDGWPKIGSGGGETIPPTSKPANCRPLASLNLPRRH
jgi:hypothetical protein